MRVVSAEARHLKETEEGGLWDAEASVTLRFVPESSGEAEFLAGPEKPTDLREWIRTLLLMTAELQPPDVPIQPSSRSIVVSVRVATDGAPWMRLVIPTDDLRYRADLPLMLDVIAQTGEPVSVRVPLEIQAATT